MQPICHQNITCQCSPLGKVLCNKQTLWLQIFNFPSLPAAKYIKRRFGFLYIFVCLSCYMGILKTT